LIRSLSHTLIWIAAQSCPAHRLAHAETVRGTYDGRMGRLGRGEELYQVKATGDVTKYSTYYRDKLVAAIGKSQTINIEIKKAETTPLIGADGKTLVPNPTGVPINIDVNSGGGITFGNPGTDQLVTISGNPDTKLKDTKGAPLVDQPADILAHELVGHAIPAIVGTDTGNAVQNENKVRAQTGTHTKANPSPQRKAEPTHVE